MTDSEFDAMVDRDQARHARWVILEDEYQPDEAYEGNYEGERFVVALGESGHGLDGSCLMNFDTFDDALAQARDSVATGWDIIGVFDLDTCELIDVDVSIVVTRSEDHATANPLANPPDVIACGAPTNIKLCDDCVDAYRNGIEPGESACEARAHGEFTNEREDPT